MEITIVFSWGSFWLGVGATVLTSIVTLFITGVALALKRKKKGSSRF